MGQIKIVFWFDVEDFINPESEEALLAILKLLDKRGITGIFKLVGEKIRVLEAHQRTDILERLQRHELGYHTNWHSIPPVVTQYLEPLGFREGAEQFEIREGSGFADLQRITGGPVHCYGQPGLAWAPQAHPVLNKWGIGAYLDSHNQVTLDGKPFWYGGLLHLTSLTGLMSLPLKDGALEQAKRDFDRICDGFGDDGGIISIFYHPTEFVFSRFWDAVNFAKGRDPRPSDWVKPPLRPEGEMAHYLDMVEAFVDYTLARPSVAYVGTAELRQLEQSRKHAFSMEEVVRLSGQIGDRLSYFADEALSLSASELFWTFRQYLLGASAEPELLYGPEQDVPTDPMEEVRVSDVLAAISREMPVVCGFKQLPNDFVVAGKRVNPVDMTCTLAKIIREGLQGEDRVQIERGTLAAAEYAANEGDWVKHWNIFPDDLRVPNIVKHSRLQTWTLKPALYQQ